MSSDSKTQNGKKGKRRSPAYFWVWWNDFMNGNMIPKEQKENFKMSKTFILHLCEELGPYIQNQTTQLRRSIPVEKQAKQPLPFITFQMKKD